MTILAIDPGSRVSGYALAIDSRVVHSGTVRATTLPLMTARISATVAQLHEHIADGVHLVVERTPVTSRVPRDFFMPGLAAGLWIATLLDVVPGASVELIRAGDWQRPMLGRRPTKSLSMIRARLEIGRDVGDHNEADAVCIAAWAVLRSET